MLWASSAARCVAAGLGEGETVHVARVQLALLGVGLQHDRELVDVDALVDLSSAADQAILRSHAAGRRVIDR